jgi:hypothetical protein
MDLLDQEGNQVYMPSIDLSEVVITVEKSNNENDEESSFLEYDFPWIDFEFEFDFDFLDIFKNGIDFREKGYDGGEKPKGNRDTPVVDLGGTFDVFLTFLGRQYGNGKSNDKGTNGGKPTSDDKADDIINATDNAAGLAKEAIELNKEYEMIQTITDTIDPNNNHWERKEIKDKDEK